MKSLLRNLTALLAIIGAVNWGLVGLFNFDLVQALFNTMPMLQKAVYALIGLSGLALAFFEVGEQQ